MKNKKKRLVLLDAHAIIHRAYHAIPDLTAPDGSPAGALYGLSSMLIRIIGELSPDYIAACYDLPKPTIRHEAYAEYKGTRSKIDDALISQLNSSRHVFDAFCIPMYEREGYEADDLLGTIPELLKNDKELEIIIASGDMDCLQLVEDDRVKVYTLKKGITDVILYDEKAVKERYGFTPAQIPDYKGLRGDTSDNIKGVPGIGEKTATELLAHFGTIENLYKILKKDDAPLLKAGIKPRIVGLLKEHEEDAFMSKSLATIRRDAPIMFRLPDTAYQDGARLPAILALFDELGFRSLRSRAQTLLWHETNGDSFEMPEEDKEEIDEEKFKEAQVMLWLLVSDFTNPTLDDILAYTKKDTFKEAYDALAMMLSETGRLREVYEKMEKPLIPLLMRMRKRGVSIDKKALEKLRTIYSKELEEIAARIYQHAGHEFNVASPKQLGTVLFDELELVTKGQKKTAGGQRSTKESELEKIQDLHPIVKDVLEYREVQKLLSTYIESIISLLDTEGKLHAEFLQTGTVTGRMGCANPNLQNIPIRSERGRVIRNAFVASSGYTLLALDYSQIELRLAAILSGDEKLCAIFASGRDVHQEVAAAVFNVLPEKVDREMRRRAKIINFGILYGMGVNALKAQLDSTTAEAHQFYDDYFATFKRLAEYLEETRGFARKNGYTETLFGRRRQFPEMKSPLPYVRAQAERMAINAPIQGTQADIIKLAMVRVEELLEKNNATEDVHLLLQVHDELVYEIKTERLEALSKEIKTIMEISFPEAEKAGVPIKTEGKTGINWGEMESL